MADTVVVARGVLTVGKLAIGPVAIPLGVVAVGIVLSKANWLSPAVRASIQVDVSMDSGANWTPRGGFIDEPGAGADVHAVLTAREPNNPNRLVRATLTVAGGPLDTTISVRLLTGLEPRVLR